MEANTIMGWRRGGLSGGRRPGTGLPPIQPPASAPALPPATNPFNRHVNSLRRHRQHLHHAATGALGQPHRRCLLSEAASHSDRSLAAGEPPDPGSPPASPSPPPPAPRTRPGRRATTRSGAAGDRSDDSARYDSAQLPPSPPRPAAAAEATGGAAGTAAAASGGVGAPGEGSGVRLGRGGRGGLLSRLARGGGRGPSPSTGRGVRRSGGGGSGSSGGGEGEGSPAGSDGDTAAPAAAAAPAAVRSGARGGAGDGAEDGSETETDPHPPGADPDSDVPSTAGAEDSRRPRAESGSREEVGSSRATARSSSSTDTAHLANSSSDLSRISNISTSTTSTSSSSAVSGGTEGGGGAGGGGGGGGGVQGSGSSSSSGGGRRWRSPDGSTQPRDVSVSGSTGGRVPQPRGTVDRLARVITFVERELLGDPERAATAAAVRAVQPDVSMLPTPTPPDAATQPLELFSEPPLTGRLLARAAAEVTPQRQRPMSPGCPSEDDWRLLGGGAAPGLGSSSSPSSSSAATGPLSAVSGLQAGDGSAGRGPDGAAAAAAAGGSASAVADELFRDRERELRRYKSYVRQFVLRTASPSPGGSGTDVDEPVDGSEDAAAGGGGGGGVGRHRRGGRGLEAGSAGKGSRAAAAAAAAAATTTTTTGEGTAGDLQRALVEEAAAATDWLQLRALMEAAESAGLRHTDPRVIAALVDRAAGLLAAPQALGGGATQVGGGDRPVGRPWGTATGALAGARGAGGGGGGGGGGGADGAAATLSMPGPAEAAAVNTFLNQLAAAAAAALSRRTGPARATATSAAGLAAEARCSGRDLARIAYGMGALRIRSRNLYDTVLRESGLQLRAAAAARAAATAAAGAAAAALAGGAGSGSGSSGSGGGGRAPRGKSPLAEMTAAATAATAAGGAVSNDSAASSSSSSSSSSSPPTSSRTGRRSETDKTGSPAAAPSTPTLEPTHGPWTVEDLAALAFGVASAYDASGSGSSSGSSSSSGGNSAGGDADGAAAPPLPLPDKTWLRALCDVSWDCPGGWQPAAMWQLLWSLARLSYVPPEGWVVMFLERARDRLAEFDPEGLCRLLWSLAALDLVPDRLWLRGLVGQVHNRLRDLRPDQLVSLYGSLSRLGYAPRPEVGAGLHAAAARLMGLMSGEQLAALAYAAASFDRWRPGGSFLRSLAQALRAPLVADLTPAQASRLMWCWARSGANALPPPLPLALPQTSQTSQGRTLGRGGTAAAAAAGPPDGLTPELMDALMDRVLSGLRSAAVDGTDLSMALWAAAVLRRPPSGAWMAAWWRAAADPRVTATFSGTCVAQSLWAAAQLRTLVGPFDDAWLYGTDDDGGGGDGGDCGGVEGGAQPPSAAAIAALLAQMSSLLRSTSTANLSTTIAALADLQYRPSDPWMTLFAAEARRRLDSETAVNEDHGFIAYGLAVLGWPLEAPWIRELAAGGFRRLPGMSGHALGLFLWGLSQYGWSTDSNRFWSRVFSESGAKWDSCSARSVVLLYCAVADMMPPNKDPPLQWQRQLAKALRLRVPRPPAGMLIPAALRAAAGGCLGPSPLRLRGPAAAAAATPGGPLHVSGMPAGAGGGGGGGGAGGGVVKTRRRALDESLWSSLTYSANLYGDLGVLPEDELMEEQQGAAAVQGRFGGAGGGGVGRAGVAVAVAGVGWEAEDEAEEVQEGEVVGPEFPEEGLGGLADEGDWGGDPSVWVLPGDEEGEGAEAAEGAGEGEGEGPDTGEGREGGEGESDEAYYARLLQEMYDSVEEVGGDATGGGGSVASSETSFPNSRQRSGKEQRRQQQEVSETAHAAQSTSPYIFDPRLRGPDAVDPYGLLGPDSAAAAAGGIGIQRRGTGVRQRVYGAGRSGVDDDSEEDGGEDGAPFLVPLPAELTDPRDHPALAAAAAEMRVWWPHDVVDELRWLWGFPGALRELPPWVRQPSLSRLRKMLMRR